MTVVNPKSISGINSITTGSGSDNLLTIHTSDASSTERVRINSSGDVIVGSGITVSPDGDIFATGVTTSTTFVGNLTGNVTGNISGGTVAGSTGTFTGDVDIADKIVHTGDTNTAIRFPDADTITTETGGSERTRIDSSGRLLLGTDTSRAAGGNTHKLFQIESTDASSGISLTRNSATTTPSIISFAKSRGTSNGSNTIIQDNDELGRIKFSGADGTDLLSEAARIQSFVDGTPGSDDMPGRLTFSTTADGAVSPTERVRIDSSGNFGLGTASPTYKNAIFGGSQRTLHVSGTTAPQLRIESSTSGQADLFLQAGNSGSDAFIGNAASNGDLVFTTNNGGTQGNKVRHDGGICFGTDNATANALDDYEEGTWTPSSNAGSITIGSAHYVKIGSQVTAQAYITFPSMSGSSGVNIASFPYATATSNDFFSCAVQSNANAGSQIQGQFSNSTMTLTAPNGGGFSINTMSGKVIVFSITYTIH